MALDNIGRLEDGDRTIHDDTRDVLTELRFLRNHLTSTDAAHHSPNTSRLEQLEDGLREQNELLRQISQQTACIPDLKKAQDDHADRIDQLESDKDKVLGAKATIGVIGMISAGAIGAWIKSLFDGHSH